jgi:1-deoxy-D-xylulose-5-phosphate synthase
VVDARTVKPLDPKAYEALFARHRAVLTVEDNVLSGGYGSNVALLMGETGQGETPVRHVTLPDEFVTHGDVATLHRILGMDHEGIYKKAVELIQQTQLHRAP